MSPDPTGEVQRFHEALERAGLAPRWSASGGVARCPAHDDKRASLTYSEGQGGRLLVRCHAGCEFRAILDAVPFELARGRISEQRVAGATRHEVARYAYRDESGALLFEVVRYAPKDFRVCRPDSTGGYVWNLKGVRDVLYNLPAVAETIAQAGTVYVVEGEKDVETLRAHGLVATTNRGGANKWAREYGRTLARASRVVILPDNDAPGRAHAARVAKSVRAEGGADVRVLELPGLPPKGDVSDWFAAGGTPERLAELESGETQAIPATVAPTPPNTDDAGFGLTVVRGSVRVVGIPQRSGKPAVELTFEGADSPALDVVNLLSQADRDRFAAQVPEGSRSDAVEALTELGRRVARHSPAPEAKRGAGQELELADVEPWPKEVSPGDLLANLVLLFRRYIASTQEALLAVSLWAMFTHVHDAFDVSPILCITSPEKQCGKTHLLTVLGALVRRHLGCASITSAAVFRTVEACQPTLLLDEADKRFENDEELRVIYNSGWTRGGFAVRTAGKEDPKPLKFSTWCPKAIALIGDLPDTLQDRSIIVRLRRRLEHERVERLRSNRVADENVALVQQMARFAQDYAAELSELDPEAPAGLSDRAVDNWRPLFAIAAVCGGSWLDAARRAALALSGVDPTADSGPRLELLRDLETVLADELRERVPSSELLARLLALPDSRWKEWSRGRGLSPRAMASLLKPYGIDPRLMRDGPDSFRGYSRTEIMNEARRYLRHAPGKSGVEALHASQAAPHAANSEFPTCYTADSVTRGVGGNSPRNSRAVTDVTLPTAEFDLGPEAGAIGNRHAGERGHAAAASGIPAQPFSDTAAGSQS